MVVKIPGREKNIDDSLQSRWLQPRRYRQRRSLGQLPQDQFVWSAPRISIEQLIVFRPRGLLGPADLRLEHSPSILVDQVI